jgi:uncharacterized protein (DUF2147 family)
MKGPCIIAASALVICQAAHAGPYLDTAIGGTDAHVKIEDCGKKVCGTFSFGGHKFVVKDSDIAAALKDSDIFSKFKDLKLFDDEPASPVTTNEPKVAPPPAANPAASQAAPAEPITQARPIAQGHEPVSMGAPSEPAMPAAAPPVVRKEVVEKKVAAFDPTSPIGEWIVEDGRGRVQIRACGADLCGEISAAKNPNDTDRHNPDVAKRNRSVIGMPILLDMKPTKPNRWEGRIYNPEDGKTYTSNLSIKSPDVLRVEGCAFGGLICGGQNWTRATTGPQG